MNPATDLWHGWHVSDVAVGWEALDGAAPGAKMRLSECSLTCWAARDARVEWPSSTEPLDVMFHGKRVVGVGRLARSMYQDGFDEKTAWFRFEFDAEASII